MFSADLSTGEGDGRLATVAGYCQASAHCLGMSLGLIGVPKKERNNSGIMGVNLSNQGSKFVRLMATFTMEWHNSMDALDAVGESRDCQLSCSADAESQ